MDTTLYIWMKLLLQDAMETRECHVVPAGLKLTSPAHSLELRINTPDVYSKGDLSS